MWSTVKRYLFPRCQFEVVASTEQMKRIMKLRKVSVVVASGSTLAQHQRDLVLQVTCPPSKIEKVIRCVELPRPPSQLDSRSTRHEDAKRAASDQQRTQNLAKSSSAATGTDAAGSSSPPSSAPNFPSVANVDSTIELGQWDGKRTLHFSWDPAPDPFSEVSDPSGTNWRSGSNIRRANPTPLKELVLQYRQGMSATWINVPCTLPDGRAEVVLEPASVDGKAYRGFQSRWIVDGELFLTPLERAPTLANKVMSLAKIRELVKNLPVDQQQKIESIPNEDVRKALTAVENYLPMNTWDYSFGVRTRPGVVVNGEPVLTSAEKIQLAAEAKLNDPQVRAAWRGAVMKSPLMMMNTVLSSIGLSLEALVSNLDFFIPNQVEPDFDELEKIDAEAEREDALRRDMQRDVNKLYPQYLNGLRVVPPGLDSLRRANKAKRPLLRDSTLPVAVKLIFTDDSDDNRGEPKKVLRSLVQFVFWLNDAYDSRICIPCQAAEGSNSAFTAQFVASPGVYRYHWLADGVAMSSHGRIYSDNASPESSKPPGGLGAVVKGLGAARTSYEEFVVESRVMFGVGIAV